ncbi:GA-binding protein subunit beta-2-like protein [Drosera capensis]
MVIEMGAEAQQGEHTPQSAAAAMAATEEQVEYLLEADLIRGCVTLKVSIKIHFTGSVNMCIFYLVEVEAHNISWLTELTWILSITFSSCRNLVTRAPHDPFPHAARYDELDDIRSLYAAGVSLDSKDEQGRTALHMAAANGHLDVVEFLLSKGVDVDACNQENNTPLHWACLNGRKEVIESLIMAGANVSALNSHDRTPMDEALVQNKTEVIDVFNMAVAQLELCQTTVS